MEALNRRQPGADLMMPNPVENNRRRSREAGFDRHLIKPVEPEVLPGLLARNHQEVGGR